MASRKYADVSWFDICQIFLICLGIPFVMAWNLIKFLFIGPPVKGMRFGVAIAAVRFLCSRSSIPQLQYVNGTTLPVYKAWAKKNKLPVVVEELVADARLLWIGPKQTKRVILYFHGRAYLAPLMEFSVSFWRYVQLELQKRDCEVGVAIFSYSLFPEAPFPSQLRQATIAVDHLLAQGVHPTNLQIVGDSAGGNLVLELISHLLHPLDPSIKIQTPFKSRINGVYLMSPWVHIQTNEAAYLTNRNSDLFDVPCIIKWSRAIKDDVPVDNLNLPYIEPSSAPISWFDDIHTVVDRILVTAGEAEIFKDDITNFSKVLARGKANFKFVVQEHGIHDDPFFDFLSSATPPPEKLGTLTPLIIDWLESGFNLVDSDI